VVFLEMVKGVETLKAAPRDTSHPSLAR